MYGFSPFTPNDQATVLRLMHDFYTIDQYPFDAEKAGELFNQFVADPTLGQGYLITHNGAVAGYLLLSYFFSFEFGGRMALVDELYIDAAHRGKGLGQRAIEHAKAQMKSLNIVGYYLEVEPHNEVAKKLYLGQGFEQHKRGFMRYTPNV